MSLLLFSCNEKRTSYIPVDEVGDSISTSQEKDKILSSTSFKIPYKDSHGVKLIHVKLNDTAGFDAIFDTGCSGMLISLQEASALAKYGTLTKLDRLGSAEASIASGEVIENAVFNIHEVSLVDTEGKSHVVNDVPVTIIENPRADVLVGNAIIDQLAKYAYTIDLQERVIVFQ